MNIYWRYLQAEALNVSAGVFGSSMSFSSDVSLTSIDNILTKSNSIPALQESSLVSVKIFDRWVVKQDCRPVRRRYRTVSIGSDNVRGLYGPMAEAVNTVWASCHGVPGHTLIGFNYDRIRRRTSLIFERLYLHPASELLKQYDVNSVLQKVASLLLVGLERGVFHCDTNLSNIMLDANLCDAQFIDFQFSIKRNCSIGEALALQLATLRDWRLAPYISKEKYDLWVRSYLLKTFSEGWDYYEVFQQYSDVRLNGPLRRERLKIVGKGQPNFFDGSE